MSYIIHAWLPSKQQFNWGDVYSWFGEGNGTPLQYSCLENPMDGGAWYAAAHGVAELDMTERLHFHALEKEMATHSSVLAWRVPVTVEPGGLPSMGSNRVGHDWNNLAAAAYSWLMHGWCSMVHAHCWTRESLVYRKECSSESLGAVVEDLREGKFNRSGSQRREDGLRWKQDSGRKQGTLQIFFFFF